MRLSFQYRQKSQRKYIVESVPQRIKAVLTPALHIGQFISHRLVFCSSTSPRTWLCKNMNVTQLVKHFGQNQPHNGEKRKYKSSSSSSSSSSLGTAKVCLKYNNNLSIWFCWVYRRQNRGNKPGAASPAWLLTLILTSFDKMSKSVRFLGNV